MLYRHGLFYGSLKVNHDFSLVLLMFFAEELQESEKNMRDLAHMQVKARIGYALLRLKDHFGLNDEQELNFQPTRQDLASYAGTTYETTFRVMNEFIQESVVGFSGKKLSILNEENLRKMIE